MKSLLATVLGSALAVAVPQAQQPSYPWMPQYSPAESLAARMPPPAGFVARDSAGRRVFLLAQSYLPAQDIHILQNPDGGLLGPWYDIDFGATLRTPEWTFASGHLRRFSGQ